MIAIFAYKKMGINMGFWVTAVIAGGLFGIMGTYFGDALTKFGVPAVIMNYLTLIGMGLSLILSLISVNWKEKN